MDAPLLTLYFDGLCPLCALEVRRLRQWDKGGRLGFVDITLPGFDPGVLGVDMAALNREMHAVTHDGRVLVAIDTIVAAYTLVGRGWLVWPLRTPLLRSVMARGYQWFARNRYRISRALGYSTGGACSGDACGIAPRSRPLP